MLREAVPVVIVGGGIGGLSLAIALRKFGIECVVCERAPALHEIGAGLLLTPNACAVLQQLGILEAVQNCGRVIETWKILDAAGRVLQTLPGRSGRIPSVSISRPALQQSLAARLDSTALRLDHEVIAISTKDQENAMLHFANGNMLRAVIVIGADGAHSAVRRIIFKSEPARHRGYCGWRGLVSHIAEEWHRGLVTESWGRGMRFGIAPIDATRSYWYASENVAADFDVPPGVRKQRLARVFCDWHEPIPMLIEQTREEDILLHQIFDQPRLKSWRRENVALLGDAAHAMTPNLGQGAAMALEDAWTLARCLAARGVCVEALAQYERERHWRARWMVWQSRQLGRVIQLENPLFVHARDFALRCIPDRVAAWSLAPIFNFRA